MTVQDYAEDMNFTVQDVLNKCEELGIKAKSKSDILDDDAIVMLDNTMNVISTNEELNFEETDAIDNAVEDLMLDDNLKSIDKKHTVSKERINKKQDKENSNKDFLNKKKQMYKNKEKLTSNTTSSKDDTVVLYKEGMSVQNLADELGVPGVDLVKKLITLGMMLSLPQAIDFETAELLASEYNKTLKKIETQDISNLKIMKLLIMKKIYFLDHQ